MDEPKQKPHLAGEPSLRIAQPYAHDQIANAAAPKLRVSLGDLAPVIQKSASSTHKSNPRIKEDPPLSDFADTESPDRAIDPFQLAQASTERRSSSLPTAPAATVIPSGSEITASGSVNTVAGDTPSFGDWVSNAAQTSWESIAAGGWWSVAGGLAGAMNIDRRIEISKRTSSASIDLGDLLTGRVIDGPVSGANVYVDENDDGIAQASELIGQTDANGNFSIRTTKVGDYIITGGTSTDTGLANNLTLKGVAGSTVITPLTTLVEKYMEMAGVSSDTAESAVKAALGLTGYGIDLRTYDPLAHGDTDATALAIQKLSVQLASAAEIYEKVGSGYGDKFLTAIVAKIDDGTFSAGNTIDFTDGTATTGDLALLQTELETQANTTLSSSLISSVDTAATSIGAATTLATSGAGSLTTTQQSALNATLTVAEAANASGSYGLLDTAANLYADAITNSGAGTVLAGNRNELPPKFRLPEEQVG